MNATACFFSASHARCVLSMRCVRRTQGTLCAAALGMAAFTAPQANTTRPQANSCESGNWQWRQLAVSHLSTLPIKKTIAKANCTRLCLLDGTAAHQVKCEWEKKAPRPLTPRKNTYSFYETNNIQCNYVAYKLGKRAGIANELARRRKFLRCNKVAFNRSRGCERARQAPSSTGARLTQRNHSGLHFCTHRESKQEIKRAPMLGANFVMVFSVFCDSPALGWYFLLGCLFGCRWAAERNGEHGRSQDGRERIFGNKICCSHSYIGYSTQLIS